MKWSYTECKCVWDKEYMHHYETCCWQEPHSLHLKLDTETNRCVCVKHTDIHPDCIYTHTVCSLSGLCLQAVSFLTLRPRWGAHQALEHIQMCHNLLLSHIQNALSIQQPASMWSTYLINTTEQDKRRSCRQCCFQLGTSQETPQSLCLLWDLEKATPSCLMTLS